MKELTLGYSPCPNDTFIFYALVHRRIDTGDVSFREILEDVETLNMMARQGKLDVTKISFHAFGHLRDNYCLLRSGGALGRGCGPLVVARERTEMHSLRGRKIAVPGRLTTAYLLLKVFDPLFSHDAVIMPFNEIIPAVVRGDVDAGLIIHESRFTYEQSGLQKILDLGEWWESITGLPIPLGCIAARRELGPDIIGRTETYIRKSVEYAFANREEPKSYIRQYSQELEDGVIDSHIGLYVNDFTMDIGDGGILAVQELFRRGEKAGIIPPTPLPLFNSTKT